MFVFVYVQAVKTLTNLYIYAGLSGLSLLVYAISTKVRKYAKIKNLYNEIPHLTQDTIWTQENITYKGANSPFLARLQGIDITAGHKTQIIKRIHKRGVALEGSERKLLGGLNMFEDTNITLISDVDHDR